MVCDSHTWTKSTEWGVLNKRQERSKCSTCACALFLCRVPTQWGPTQGALASNGIGVWCLRLNRGFVPRIWKQTGVIYWEPTACHRPFWTWNRRLEAQFINWKSFGRQSCRQWQIGWQRTRDTCPLYSLGILLNLNAKTGSAFESCPKGLNCVSSGQVCQFRW